MMQPYFYIVKSVRQITDGDTIMATLDLGFGLVKTDIFRLCRFDAPETYRPKTEAERAGGYKCTEELTRILTMYKDSLYARTSKSPSIYGRYDAELYTRDKSDNYISINDMMIKFILFI